MEHIKKSFDDGLRRIRGKIELVKRPHVSVKEWLESNISISIISSRTGSQNASSSTTSGPSTCSLTDVHEVIHVNDLPAKPSKFMSMNLQLQDIFEDDDSVKMAELLEKGLDPNFIDLNGKPLIYRSVEEGKYNILDTMLEFGYGCDVNSTCHNEMNGGWTSLHLACHLADLRAVEILLGVHNDTIQRLENCDVNAVDIDGRTPLHVLAASSSWHCAHSVIHHTDVSYIPPSHNTPPHTTHIACRRTRLYPSNQSGSPDSAHNVLAISSLENQSFGSSDSVNANMVSVEGKSDIILANREKPAIVIGNDSNCSKLVNCGLLNKHFTDSGVHLEDNSAASSPNSLDSATADVTKFGLTLVSESQKILHQSCNGAVAKKKQKRKVTPHGEIMKILLRAGGNANRVDEYNGTPLHICALRGNLEGVKILLEHGADYDLVDNMCETALIKAIIHHRAAVVKCLLKCQHAMPEMKRYELSELIFTIIEDLSNNTEEKDEKEVVDIIRALIKKRIHINVTDSRRRTPLHVAVLYGCKSVATMLIKQPSCYTDNEDEDGFTPLFLAAWNPKKVNQNTQINLLQQLINHGAIINHFDICKVLPVNAALESGQFESVMMLIQHGSVVSSNKWFCSSVEILRQNTSTLPFVERFILSMINNYRHTPSLIEVATILGQQNLIQVMIQAGADASVINFEVMSRWISNETRVYVVEDLGLYARYLEEMVSEVLTLKDLCRICIRQSLGTDLWSKTSRLPLPDILQDFVMMKDLSLSSPT